MKRPMPFPLADPFSTGSGPDRDPLIDRTAKRTRDRLRRLRRRLARHPSGTTPRMPRQCLDELIAVLRHIPREAQRRTLRGPDVRGFLGEAELWLDVSRLAADTGAHSRTGSRRRLLEARLFDRVSGSEHLLTLVPYGRIDTGFSRRAARFARRRLIDASADLAACVIGLRLAFPIAHPLRLSLRFREDPEQGRPHGRIDLGTVLTDEGPLGIESGERRSPKRRRAPDQFLLPRSSSWIVATVKGRTLVLAPRHGSSIVFAGAGSRHRLPRSERTETRSRRDLPLRLVRRETVPGTSILLTPALRSRPRRLSVGSDVPGLGARLATALRIVQIAWPGARREIAARTAAVVPVHESGLVSYSLAARPGISFINVFGKSIIELADDMARPVVASTQRAGDREDAQQVVELSVLPHGCVHRSVSMH